MGASNLDDNKLREYFRLLSVPSPNMPEDDDLCDLLMDFIVVQAGVAGLTSSAIGGTSVSLGDYDPEEVCKRIEGYDTTHLSPGDYLLLADWKSEADIVMSAAMYIRTAK